MTGPSLPFDAIAEARRQWEHRGWPEASAMAACTSIMRAHQIILARVEAALKPLELTFARYEALVLLNFSREGQLPLGKMGNRLMLHPTSVTNIIDRLEEQGFIQRVPHPTDRRTTLAQITDDGRKLVDDVTKAAAGARFGMGNLTEQELDTMTQLVTKLRVDAGDFPD